MEWSCEKCDKTNKIKSKIFVFVVKTTMHRTHLNE